MIFIITWVAGILVGIIDVILNPAIHGLAEISATMLFFQLTVTLTLTGFIGAVGHAVFSDAIAKKIGWEAGSPFQKELGYAEFGYFLAGIFCIFFHREFWLATIIIISPLFVFAALNHLRDMLVNRNFALHNTWTIIPDLLMPISWITFFILSTAK